MEWSPVGAISLSVARAGYSLVKAVLFVKLYFLGLGTVHPLLPVPPTSVAPVPESPLRRASS